MLRLHPGDDRLRHHRDLLRGGPRHRVRRPAVDQDRSRLLPVRALAAGVDHRPGVHRGQPGRARDPRPVGQRRPVRRVRPCTTTGSAPCPAMVFLGLVMMPFYYGAKVRSVPEYLRLRFGEPAHAFNAAHVRGRHRADQRRQPVRAGADHPPAARLAGRRLDPDRRGDRARLHHARRAHLGDLQRGPPVLHHLRGADPAHDRRAAARWAAGPGSSTGSRRSSRSATPACTPGRA